MLGFTLLTCLVALWCGSRSDIKLPSEMNPTPPGAEELSKNIKEFLKEEKDFYVIVLCAMGKEQIIDTKVMTN